MESPRAGALDIPIRVGGARGDGGVEGVRQQAGQSALAVRNRSTADRRYSSLASTTDASDQAADMPVKFIGLVDIGVGAESDHEPETRLDAPGPAAGR
jgi:hypothetical protein